MANSFSLLQLPIEERLHVIRCMDSRSLLFFSLLSKNAKNLAKSLQTEPSTVHVTIGYSICCSIPQYGFHVSFYTESETNKRMLQKPSKVWISQGYDIVQRDTMVIPNHSELNYWMEHISDVFNIREGLKMTFLPGFHFFDLQAVKNIFGSCKTLEIGFSRPESHVKMILNTFTSKVKELNLDFNPFSLGETGLQTMLLQNIGKLELGYIDEFERFTLNDLLACNASHINLSLNQNFEYTNDFLKLWMKGANPRLQSLSIKGINGNVLKGIKVTKWITKDEFIVRNNKFYSARSRGERTAVDIHRFDGNGATVIIKNNNFSFFVWDQFHE